MSRDYAKTIKKREISFNQWRAYSIGMTIFAIALVIKELLG